MSAVITFGRDLADNAFQLQGVEASDTDMPETARATLPVLVDGLRRLADRPAEFDAEIACRAREDEAPRLTCAGSRR